jgi:hypothetical protein
VPARTDTEAPGGTIEAGALLAAPHAIGRRRAIGVLLAAGLVADAILLRPALDLAESLHFGGDLGALQGATTHWLAGDGFYLPYQLAGPYLEDPLSNILYPPVALALFIPFTVLPAFLWWLIPAAITAATVWYWRPTPWALVGIGICALSYPTIIAVHQGNPVMWIAAFVALGTRWPAYWALVFLKPSLFPFALLGIRHRRWWLVTGILVLMSLLLVPMTVDWLTVLLNIRGGRTGLLYSWPETVILAMPILAWVGRSDCYRHGSTQTALNGAQDTRRATR